MGGRQVNPYLPQVSGSVEEAKRREKRRRKR